MSKHLLLVLILAAGSDGGIQKERLALNIHKYKEHYPSLKSLSMVLNMIPKSRVFLIKSEAGMGPEYLIDK